MDLPHQEEWVSMVNRDQEHERSKSVHHHKSQEHEVYGERTGAKHSEDTFDSRFMGNAQAVSTASLQARDAAQVTNRGLPNDDPMVQAARKHDSINDLMSTAPAFESNHEYVDSDGFWGAILHPNERADEDWIA